MLCGILIYSPSLRGDFVFDDRTLPMFYAHAASLPFQAWIGVRPFLMFTYFWNFLLGGTDPLGYHVVNVLLHAISSVLMVYVVRKYLALTGVAKATQEWLSIFCGALFLVHPVQTEAVSYIASRSEDLSVAFFLTALLVFLYRPEPAITFKRAMGLLILYAAAMSSKEHTAMLPLVLLLTDYTWNPGFSFRGIWRNWKLYAPLVLLTVGGLLFIATEIRAGANIGSAETGVAWYQYLFTQFRAITVYARLFVLPYGQNVDYNFPVSRTILDHGAIAYGIALFAVSILAIVYRKKYPLAFFGWFTALILLAPTSSVLPIKDTLVDRRMYLPFIGFLLILCEAIRRLKWEPKRTLALGLTILALFGFFAWQRNGTWVNMESLWKDSVEKNPDNPRALMGLGDAYAISNHCAEAIPIFKRAEVFDHSYRVVYDLASAEDCANQLPAALDGYREALALRPSAQVWTHIGILLMKSYKFDEALDAFNRAEAADPNYAPNYDYRGVLFLAQGRFDDASAQFQTALRLEPADLLAPRGLERARDHVRQY